MKKKSSIGIFMVSALVLSVMLLSSCFLFNLTPSPSGTPTVTINPSTVTNGSVGTPYTFTVTAKNIPSGTNEVTFDYSFGDGSATATGSKTATVSNHSATITISHVYTVSSAFGLTIAVSDDTDVLATGYASIIMGTANPGRDYEVTLTDLDEWVAADSGGYGITIDTWDISQLPKGCKFDLKFDTMSIPDKIIVEYPDGTIVLDTGWRGSSSYDGDPLYPGGVVGVGQGQMDSIFKKSTQQYFKITIIGPDRGTAWNYDIRAHN